MNLLVEGKMDPLFERGSFDDFSYMKTKMSYVSGDLNLNSCTPSVGLRQIILNHIHIQSSYDSLS